MRLDRLVSQHSGRSRRDVAAWIRAGRVSVAGAIVRDPGLHVATSVDAVLLDGDPVRVPAELTLMLHKPPGCISATEDPLHPTVLDLLPPALRRPRLAPIGRLDKDTTGLLLLTTDGGLQHLIAHPRRKVEKAYVATLRAGTLAADAEQRFAAGMRLADGTPCRPAGLRRFGPVAAAAHDQAEAAAPAGGDAAGDAAAWPLEQVEVVLHEGRFHQVKRMLGACGGHVVALHRARIGPLLLDPALAPGEARALRDEELLSLRAAAGATEFAGERPRS